MPPALATSEMLAEMSACAHRLGVGFAAEAELPTRTGFGGMSGNWSDFNVSFWRNTEPQERLEWRLQRSSSTLAPVRR